MKIKIWFWILCTVIPGLLSAQNVLSGTVVDRENLPLAGATVSVAGSYDYTISDSLGHFAVALNQSLPIQLSVHLLGFEPQALTINSSSHVQVQLLDDNELFEVVVTARRRSETAQDVPIPITVLGGKLIQESGAFNVNRMKELVPSVQLYSSNPRNTGLSIRGLGTTFGLTNDGIDPGVGFYVDGVYYVRTAATTLDFIDVEQIEVLRGPQGTLFGKNTVAGALNITTRKPDFKGGGDFEMSFGDYGFIQAKGSLTGPLGKKLAARLSFSGTQRDGLLTHAVTQKKINDLNNLGLRGQLLFVPNDKTELRFIADVSRQRPDGYAQVFAGVAPTLRAEYRQFENIISDLEYNLPARNPFDRIIDHDTPWRSGQDFGGISLNADFKLGPGTLTSTSSWRYWNWDPSNDRDFTGLPVLTLSQAPSKHNQWSQEVRYAGTVSEKLSGVIGVFLFGQDLRTNPYHTEESGAAQWRFSQNSASELWKTPGLFEGYGIRTTSQLNTISGAIFSQVDIELFKGLHLLPGLRFNYDKKEVDFNRQTYGGLVTEDPALIALKNVVYTNQAFEANIDDTNLSGQLTLSYKASDHFNAFATYSTGFKPVGLNLGGLPSANGAPLIELAVVKPEHISHTEIGIKTKPNDASTLNLTVYNSDINNF